MTPRNPSCPATGTTTRTGCTALPPERSARAPAMAGIRSSIRRSRRTASSSRFTTSLPLLRGHAESPVDIRSLIDDPVLHDGPHAPDVTDVTGGVAVHEDDVGELARRDRAEPKIPFHDTGGTQGRDLQDPGRRNAGLLVKLQLPVQGESGERIGAGDDPNVGIVQGLRPLQHLAEGILICP